MLVLGGDGGERPTANRSGAKIRVRGVVKAQFEIFELTR